MTSIMTIRVHQKRLHKNTSGTVSKLIPTLNKKTNYVLHYRNLKLYLSLGLRLTKIHRVLEFSQSSWLKDYIDFNTKRTNAKNRSAMRTCVAYRLYFKLG